MIVVPVAQDDGIDPADGIEVRQPDGLRPPAAIEQEPRPDTAIRRACMLLALTDRGPPTRAAAYNPVAEWWCRAARRLSRSWSRSRFRPRPCRRRHPRCRACPWR